jgi:hypothetical protein
MKHLMCILQIGAMLEESLQNAAKSESSIPNTSPEGYTGEWREL